MAEKEKGSEINFEKPAPNLEKLKALRATMDKIEKSYGKGSIMKMGDDHVEEVSVIPSGSIGLDAAYIRQPQDLVELIERLQHRLHDPADIGQERVRLSASIGVALYPEHGLTPDSLISAADNAMHEAKRRGRVSIQESR